MAELGSPRLGRCAAFVASTAVAFLGTTHLVHASPAGLGFGPALTWLAGWVLLGCCGWATTTAGALLVAAVRGPDLLTWCCPRGWRPLVLAAAGAAVAAGALAPAQAQPASTGLVPAARPHPGALAALPVLDGPPARLRTAALPTHPPAAARDGVDRRIEAGWHPPSLARPVDHPPAVGSVRAVPTQAGPQSPRAVEVRPGDSLWRIAARFHPGADDAAVAAAVAELYRLNRMAIGSDPDLLHPGLRLQQPHSWPVSWPEERNPR